MSIKLKALSLGLLAVLAMAAFAAINASATVRGHFTHDAATDHATILGTENGAPHDLLFNEEGSNVQIVCTHTDYHGTAPAKTVTSLTVTPAYTNCGTVGEATWGGVKIHTNGCAFILSSRSTEHGTVEIECPAGKAIEITQSNCTTTIPAQKPSVTVLTGGVVYHTTTEGSKHTLTPTVTVKKITGHFHAGLCIFVGTNHTFELTGALTVAGQDTAGEQINITHT